MLEFEDLKKQPMFCFWGFGFGVFVCFGVFLEEGGVLSDFYSASFNRSSSKQISRLLFNKLNIMYFIKELCRSDTSLKNYITLNEI